MATPVHKSLLGRTRRLLLPAILAITAAWLAITRWNGVPANPSTPVLFESLPVGPIDPSLDRTDELAAALSAIPPLPALVLPPPPQGMKWNQSFMGLVVGDSVCGEWTVETRPGLAGVIQYLKTPGVEQLLARLSSVPSGAFRAGGINFSSFRQAVNLLIARARWRVADHGDFKSAWGDLSTVLRLASTGYQSNEWLVQLVSVANEAMAEWELIRLCHENPITREQFKQVESDLATLLPTEQGIWKGFVAGRCGARERILDFVYTDDGAGDGWLVLNRMDDILLRSTWPTESRSGAWNMFSALFNGRRTVTGKLKSYREACESVSGLPFSKARLAAERADLIGCNFSILDGPIAMLTANQIVAYGQLLVVRRTAIYRAALTSAALSAYRHDHGLYPATLDSIVGAYLQCPPMDPYGEQPLRYRPLEGGRDFLLYAVGPDQKDNGGVKRTPGIHGTSSDAKEDVIFDHSRQKTNFEPILEPLKK